MDNKTFMFVSSWIIPLRKLSLEERWNVVEAIVEYSLNGEHSISFSAVEDMAFTFIRADLDRMQSKYKAVCQKRRNAANTRWNSKDTRTTPDADNACKSIESIPEHYKADTDTNTDTDTETDTETVRTSSSTSKGVRVRKGGGNAKPYDESQLLPRFFAPSNQARLEAIAMTNHVGISDLRRMAEEITVQWALADKTHESYQDASFHLQYALGDKANRERKTRLQAIADGAVPAGQTNGMLGVDEYIDEQGRRTYNGVDFIPNDAPPRPGRAFYWNQTTRSWDDIQ